MNAKRIYLVIMATLFLIPAWAQIDKEALSLNISKAEEANTKKLMEYIWKRKSEVFVQGQLKLTTLTEFSFDAQEKLQAKIVDAQSDVKQKRGLRGRAQKGAIEDNMEYVQKALELSLNYTYMSKGQLLDFMGKAKVTEANGSIEAVGENVYVQGDKLLIRLDSKTYLFTYKEFSSLLGKDAISGKMNYEKFSSGTNHGTTTNLLLPAKKTEIKSVNQDYTTRVK